MPPMQASAFDFRVAQCRLAEEVYLSIVCVTVMEKATGTDEEADVSSVERKEQ
jgi:hypothetical protein